MPQATLSFKPTKGSSTAISSKEKEKAGVVTTSAVKNKPAVLELVKPVKTKEEPAKKPAQQQQQSKRRRPQQQSDSESDEEEEEYIEVPDSDEDGIAVGGGKVVPVVDEGRSAAPLGTAAEPDEHEVLDLTANDTSSSEDQATTTKAKAKAKGKGKAVVEVKEEPALGMKALMKEKEFKNGLKDALERVGGDKTISTKKEPKARTILRVFDFSYEYGPCIGMTRRERWNRAQKMGLNPPEIVRLILDTEKADTLSNEELEALRYNVLHDMV